MHVGSCCLGTHNYTHSLPFSSAIYLSCSEPPVLLPLLLLPRVPSASLTL